MLACSRTTPRVLEVGPHHRVHVVSPKGWEILEHGRQHFFQAGEMRLSLSDLGPVTAKGMNRELREARAVWLGGRRKDAFARVRDLRGPPLRFASSGQVPTYWRHWNDVAYSGERVDSAAIGAAFDELIQATKALPPVDPDSLTDYVLRSWPQAWRREIAERRRRLVHGRRWTEVRTWDRVSHLDAKRVAFVDNGGYLLVLAIESGPSEVTEPVFEGLLSSLEVAPPETLRTR